MSRARVSPNLRRRPLHDESTRFCEFSAESAHRNPNKFSDTELEEDSDDEITDVSKVDDVDEGTEQKQGLYPDISELEREDARFVIKTDRHGTLAAGQYTKTIIKTKHETNVPTESHSFPFKNVLFIFIVLMMILPIVMVFWLNTNGGPVKSAPLRVSEIVNKLKQEYVNQPSLSFRIIKKALEHVISLKNQSEPLAPAVLLLMSTKGAEDETASFAEELAELVASGNTNYQTIYGDQLQNENPDKAKKEIDDLIKGAPKYNNRIVILIRDLDVIPPKAVMMLHAYCDHENAPFKNAVFIMTINTDADLNNCESKQFDEAAESHLTRVWGDLGRDMLSPLLSRITVSVAAIYHKTKPSYCR